MRVTVEIGGAIVDLTCTRLLVDTYRGGDTRIHKCLHFVPNPQIDTGVPPHSIDISRLISIEDDPAGKRSFPINHRATNSEETTIETLQSIVDKANCLIDRLGSE